MVLNCHRKGGLQMSMPKAGVSLVVENDQQFKAALSEVKTYRVRLEP